MPSEVSVHLARRRDLRDAARRSCVWARPWVGRERRLDAGHVGRRAVCGRRQMVAERFALAQADPSPQASVFLPAGMSESVANRHLVGCASECGSNATRDGRRLIADVIPTESDDLEASFT